jgi:FkbM family methyltransferase
MPFRIHSLTVNLSIKFNAPIFTMEFFRKIIEKQKLMLRANRYRNKLDKGGIAYLLSAIKKGQTVMDIGAHKAGYLYWMVKQTGSTGMAYSFEPQRRLYEYICKIKTIYQWDNLVVENMALSDKNGVATLYIPGGKSGLHSSPGATIVEKKRDHFEGATENVEMQSMDTYCAKYDLKPDFLKIDVEGNELRVFQGGINTLKTYKPKILVEIESRHAGEDQAVETFRLMESLGYTGHFIHGSALLPLPSFSFGNYQNMQDQENYCNNFIFEQG